VSTDQVEWLCDVDYEWHVRGLSVTDILFWYHVRDKRRYRNFLRESRASMLEQNMLHWSVSVINKP